MDMDRLGILVRHIGASQLGYDVIQGLNHYLKGNDQFDPIVFYEEMHGQMLPQCFVVLQLVEAWWCKMPMIATSLSTAYKLLNFPASTKRYYYVSDLEYMRHPHHMYDVSQKVFSAYGADRLIVRCENHALAINNGFNVLPHHICDGFDVKKIVEEIVQ